MIKSKILISKNTVSLQIIDDSLDYQNILSIFDDLKIQLLNTYMVNTKKYSIFNALLYGENGSILEEVRYGEVLKALAK